MPPRRIDVVIHFWLLVRRNPGLVCLRMPKLFIALTAVIKEFVYETLLMRANLKELDLGATNLNMETLLFNKVPQLERLHVYHTRGLSILDQDFGGLRPLVLQDNIALDSLFKMLDHLPGLERLRIKGLRFLETSIASALVAARIERSACPL
ncbi:hypothetical protein BGX33_000731 [Mortierella sp. NVP41]|nr:hypothetical protein BGX33_000731 [Mortierella sp. NVP41]